MDISQFISDYPVILAPMSGVTDFPFRYLVKSLGAGLLVSEMIASRAMIIQTKQSLQKSQIQINTAVQLAGCDPTIMADAAKLNEDMGAQIIDINFGCPVKKVVNSYAGSALMKDETTAAKILESVVKAVKIPVTLKMRTGWDNNNLNSPKLAKIAEETGIKMITIHGRTRTQMFTGKADWKFIRNIKKCVKIPVIVNGDIKNLNDIKTSLEESQADGIMIGRGAYGKPWFINQALHFIKSGTILPDPSPSEKLKIITNHYDHMIEYYGKDTGVKISKKHIGWYSSSLENSSEFRSQVNCSNDYNFIKDKITDFFSQN
ncbi:TIM-barrel, nifR3 family protein [Ehrlichia chaffeensis str. Heartland]|uniref:tRNA-dihydrouridine synthase n=1 Tax=Ehrlichia chaffeensis (strain ATCC CRL-10679 / Arkansas) TaxID=205920 RepID=Q2GG77_EHRCR|nr:tRNA dihydrouridine synthase DusB [Ehrlichia chaffeensis]ABD44911.1 putative tRNA-dihydrouridine synthase [Ehrlichia chaffeensis str. Arkansas]AHX03819.1 TIM-barrel, nifR3 family protein [Ehrlichia chaffeensis str. Heartland]AHX05456.1 TIM-barrel, nifR3 family protein [Ehrlichia chaffeensis str. Jax]AHX06444.1 TIM-barrel, nifR3 family protein [Ehrlichia chaffeensis str. Liberty]AHX07327.1 TIM-barrel, nifR3 family protein [Ehrlichia chaffeensis str. Osceola]